MLDKDTFQRIARKIDSYREEMIELQITLSAISAVGPENGGDGELLKASFLKKRLLEMGFKNYRHCMALSRRHIAGSWSETSAQKKQEKRESKVTVTQSTSSS